MISASFICQNSYHIYFKTGTFFETSLYISTCNKSEKWNQTVIISIYTTLVVVLLRMFNRIIVNFECYFQQVTTDPRYDNTHRRYVYVLTQSQAMRDRRDQPLTRSSSSSTSNG